MALFLGLTVETAKEKIIVIKSLFFGGEIVEKEDQKPDGS